ncbi:unnamed protein product [Orchesella dallaii]|uniref:Uncharacterized protein n=1 Tax=Orchesella dallaii TaxID=48710 RepID=A0ABP1S5S3_9HEXA
MIKEKYYVILNARIKRDTIKNDAMRSRTKFRFYRNQKFELLLNNKTLRREADKQKTESVQIRKEFEKATNTADEMAISYRVRTEEVCTFHEYIYCYQKILLRGSEGITIREMEKTKLRSLYEETRKHVFIVQMNQPDESAYFKKIEKLRTQFYEITEQRRELEAKLNDDDNPSRVREIDFEKLKEKENVEVLEKRLDLREENLATRDVIGLERTLMENHLTKITEDSLDQAIYLKDYYGDQVKAIVNIRKSLNNISQQIDGFICENAIASAQADIAEKHFHHCRQILQGAEERWVNGHPPTDEMEAEWKRTQWRNDLLGRAKANTNKKGFLRQVKPRNGTQIQANKWTCNKRKLEHPESSVLGWRFSAVSDPIVSHYSQIKFESKCMLGVSHSHEKKKNTKRTNK